MVLTPACAALIAAASPPGPLPTTRTSVSARTGVSRAGSKISFMAFRLCCHAHQYLEGIVAQRRTACDVRIILKMFHVKHFGGVRHGNAGCAAKCHCFHWGFCHIALQARPGTFTAFGLRAVARG